MPPNMHRSIKVKNHMHNITNTKSICEALKDNKQNKNLSISTKQNDFEAHVNRNLFSISETNIT